MKDNAAQLAELAGPAGDHEGRLTHKPPPRTLYDTAYKERWFKLKSNFLFYYRLNEMGAVDKNEPTGVFVLENVEVQKEEDADVPFGFALRWKDEVDKKHLFFAQSEASVHVWMTKIFEASYEHMRARLLMLRVQLRRRTGKDPLEQFGTPLPQRVSWHNREQLSHDDLLMKGLRLAESSTSQSMSVPASPILNTAVISASRSPSVKSLPGSFPQKRVQVPKSPLLGIPKEPSPVPPPRTNRGKKHSTANGTAGSQNTSGAVGLQKASFRSHINVAGSDNTPTNSASFKSHINDAGSDSPPTNLASFKSHIGNVNSDGPPTNLLD